MPFYLDVWDPYQLRNTRLLYPGREIKEAVEADRQERFMNYARYWSYYEGEQYDAENLKSKEKEGKGPADRLAEHQRKHAYCGVVGEGIDFITDQLMENMSIEVESETKESPIEQEIFQEIWEISEMDLVAPDLTREGLVSGDAYIQVVWDEVENTVRLIPYDAQMVDPVYDQDDYTKYDRVFISYSKLEMVEGKEEQIDYTEEFVVVENDLGSRECVKLMYKNDEEEPYEVQGLGIPFIPIVHIRSMRRRVRQSFGDSMVKKVCGDADRYNAVCQLEFLIARYNSTGHLALFGDAANIDGHQLFLGGEVADFWAFDNAIQAKEIFLPTNMQMIDSQKETLERQMFRKMGLQRMDLDDIKGLGGAPSGYSLEILNRKTDGVFRRIRKELTKSYIDLFNAVFDMLAYKQAGENWMSVDPMTAYPQRNVSFNFGSTVITDSKQIIEDYTAGLISLKRALLLKGYSETEAEDIMKEMVQEKEMFMTNEMEGISAILENSKKQAEG